VLSWSSLGGWAAWASLMLQGDWFILRHRLQLNLPLVAFVIGVTTTSRHCSQHVLWLAVITNKYSSFRAPGAFLGLTKSSGFQFCGVSLLW
jgi:hypothetical protein